MALIMPVVSRRGMTITNLTPTRTVRDIFRRLGFQRLESHRRVVLPFPSPLRATPVRVALDRAAIVQRLHDADRRVYEDHRDVVQHALLWNEHGSCYVAWTPGRRHRLPCARVHHTGNPGLFARAAPALARALLLDRGLPLLECDERMVGGADIPFSYRLRMPVGRLFRSPSSPAARVSNLYSELALMAL
jgi:hypothetical protein